MLLALVNISTFLTLVFSLSLGFYTLYRNPKSLVHRLWFLTNMAVAVWTFGYLLITYFTYKGGLFHFKLLYTGVIFIPILSFHFVLEFLYKAKKYKNLIIVGYVIGVVLLALFYFTDWLIVGTQYTDHLIWNELPGKLFFIFLLYFHFFAFYSIYLLFDSFRKNEGLIKVQSLYILVAFLFGFLGGIFNFIMDLTGIFPLGQMFVFLYPVIITYTIFLKKY
ncbi:hypothetical protein KKA15_00100 [Patescibacteria group bacterium]|nr:hypothetical protein [Patescibacteria group bacterium]